MKMSIVAGGRGVLASVGVVAIAVVLCGCPTAPEKPKTQRKEPPQKQADSTAPESPADKAAARPRYVAPETKLEPATPAEMVEQAETEASQGPRDLGPPLVDDQDQLTQFAPNQPIWLDANKKQVVMLGAVCRRDVLLEYFASNAMKSYESVLTVDVPPFIVHAALLRIGAEPGQPVRFQPRFVPPKGTEVAIEVRWKDERGKVQSAPAQHWIRDVKTKKEMEVNWVFAGSYFRKDDQSGKEYYQADYGALICLANMPEAMLDLPIESFGAVEARTFEMFEEHMPPPGTPTTIILKPIFDARSAGEKPDKQPAEEVDEKIADAKRKAVEAAENWLDLIDRGQYSRGWETASQRLNALTGRRDFIEELNDTRRPLGKNVSRKMLPPRYTRSIENAPDGQYVVIRYNAVFSKKPAVVEEVTLMLNGDNKWRVLGYRFK
ncbi:MAG: DUF4019 domain-containing protein [Pirellulales bacterium]|nr:DUF4019 domain-containing protein [Pirellulales bacterium]